jgi:hypothetical protein
VNKGGTPATTQSSYLNTEKQIKKSEKFEKDLPERKISLL